MIYPRVENLHVYKNPLDPSKWVILIQPGDDDPEHVIWVGKLSYERDIEHSVQQRRHVIEAAKRAGKNLPE